MDFDNQEDITATGIFLNVNDAGFSELSTSWNGFFQVGDRLRVRQSGFQFEVMPEIRSLVGQSADLPPSDSAFISIEAPPRLVNTEISLGSGPDREALLDFERLNLSYSTDNLEMYVGRKPISIGVLRIFPVWNKFSRPLPGLSNLSLIYGSDGAGARVQLGQVTLNAFSVLGPDPTQSMYAFEPIYYGDIAEIHLLFSQWFQQTTVGMAIARNVGGATLRLEWLDIGISPSDSDRQNQVGVGIEDAFTSNFSALAEGLYQSNGATDVSQYQLLPTSPFNQLRAIGYSYVQGAYSINSYWRVLGGALTNLVDFGSILIARTTYALTDNIDLQAEDDVPAARDNAEFSSHAFYFSDGSYIGVNTQVTAGIHLVF